MPDPISVEVRHGPHGGVLWLTVSAGGQQITFGGHCRYWVDEPAGRFGGFQCDDHADEFGGPVAFEWDGDRFSRVDVAVPDDVEVWHGEWVSDDEWRRLLDEER